jgi:SWI/SNF related-matrix-associated actin-dependent regulator of chromatin subfamily C
MFSGDFVKLTQSQPGVSHSSGGDPWSDQELLLLLEGVEMYDDDWSLIEEHVGTRTAQQCVRKFLELPIEDEYLDTEGAQGVLRFGRVPFEQADNPVMSVVAFLAGVIGPGVAAEAAKTALMELTDGEKKEENTAVEAEASEEKRDQAQKDDAMDEDAPKDEAATAEPSGSKSSTPAPSSSPSASKMPTVPHSRVVRAASLALSSSAKAATSLGTAETTQIRTTLASLIKLTLTKLELKMSQFEELEEILEEERKGLESARMGLVQERIGLKRILDGVKSELARAAGGGGTAGLAAAVGSANLGMTGQGTVVNEVGAGVGFGGQGGPVSDGSMLPLA